MKKKRLKKKKQYRDLLGELYQVLGALDAPAHVLDQVLAAAERRKLPHKTLLPFINTDKKETF